MTEHFLLTSVFFEAWCSFINLSTFPLIIVFSHYGVINNYYVLLSFHIVILTRTIFKVFFLTFEILGRTK